MPSPPTIAGYWEETEESFDKDIPGMVTSVTYYLRIDQAGDIVQIDDNGDRQQGRTTGHTESHVHIELTTTEPVIFNTTTHRFTIPRQRFHLAPGSAPMPPALFEYLHPYGQPRVPAALFTRYPGLRVFSAQVTPSGITFHAWLGARPIAINIANDTTLTESGTALESPPHSSAPAPDTSPESPRTAY